MRRRPEEDWGWGQSTPQPTTKPPTTTTTLITSQLGEAWSDSTPCTRKNVHKWITSKPWTAVTFGIVERLLNAVHQDWLRVQTCHYCGITRYIWFASKQEAEEWKS